MKRICFIFIALVIAFSGTAVVKAEKTYEKQTQLAPGVTRLDITQYTDYGAQKIHVLKIDLSNPRLKITLLTDSEGVNILSPVHTLAKSDERVIAAINADFFGWYSKDKTKGSAAGLNIRDGELLSSPPVEENLASLVFTESGDIITQYFKPNMTVTTSDGRTEKINSINKYDSLTVIAMYTSAWGKTFYSEGGAELTAVIKNDEVVEITDYTGDIEIPPNGYLLTGLTDFTDFFTNGIKVGMKLKTDILFNPHFGDIETAVGGGTVLVKNGEKAPITHMFYGRDFRSAAGVSRDGKTLYFIAADKNSSSIGMSLAELQSFMLKFGIYDGINFDGGGSTQMVARGQTDETVKYINQPENGYFRPVINALGVSVTGGERGVMEGITISSDTDEAVTKETLTVSAKVYDQLYYPMDMEITSKTEFVFSGVKGKKEGNTFVPLEGGTLLVTAKYKDYSASMTINVKDPDIFVNPDSGLYRVKSGEKVPVIINAVTKTGKTHTIPLSDTVVSVEKDILSYDGKTITAIKSGFGKITIRYEDFTLETYVSVDGVKPEDELALKEPLKDGFEENNAETITYPLDIPANYKISDEKASEGYYSGKLWFDFDNEIKDLQSAYIRFEEFKPVNEFSQISVDVYSPGFKNLVLKALIKDGDGNLKRVTFSHDLSYKGWKNVTAAIPEGLKSPAYLTRLYVVENTEQSKQRGSIYFDNLLISSDAAYISDALKDEGIKAQISITGGIKETETLLGDVSIRNVRNALYEAKVGYSFDEKIASKNVDDKNNFTIAGNLILFKAGDITAQKLDNISENIEGKSGVIITVNDMQKARLFEKEINNLAQIAPVFVVSRGEKLLINRGSENVRFITVPSCEPSLITNNKTFITLCFGEKNGKVKYKIERETLWN